MFSSNHFIGKVAYVFIFLKPALNQLYQHAVEYEKIFIEDLNLKAMQKLWGRKISDLGFYQFVQILKDVMVSTGTDGI